MSLVGVEHADPLLYSIGDPLLISEKRGKYIEISFVALVLKIIVKLMGYGASFFA